MGKAAQRRTPRDLFFTSEKVAESCSYFASYKEDGSALPRLKNTLSSAGPGGRSRGVAVPLHGPARELAKKMC